MPLPSTTMVFDVAQDPTDWERYVIDVSGLLLPGESVTGHTVETMAESLLYNFDQGTNDYATVRSGNIITMWPRVNPSTYPAGKFDTEVICPFRVTVTMKTATTPLRRKQFTVAIKIVER